MVAGRRCGSEGISRDKVMPLGCLKFFLHQELTEVRKRILDGVFYFALSTALARYVASSVM